MSTDRFTHAATALSNQTLTESENGSIMSTHYCLKMQEDSQCSWSLAHRHPTQEDTQSPFPHLGPWMIHDCECPQIQSADNRGPPLSLTHPLSLRVSFTHSGWVSPTQAPPTPFDCLSSLHLNECGSIKCKIEKSLELKFRLETKVFCLIWWISCYFSVFTHHWEVKVQQRNKQSESRQYCSVVWYQSHGWFYTTAL